MNLFKKALVASAVTASFGATAATVVPSTSALKLSAEGVEAGVAAHAAGFDFNVTIGAEHPAGSRITLTFSDGVDIGPIAAGITNAVNNATGVVGEGDAGNVTFDYGNGSFTFDNVTVVNGDQTKGESDSISFDVSLGQPLNQNAAFNVAFAAGATVSKASTADYTAEHNSTTIDTGTGTIATEHTQFAVSVSTPLNAVINRTNNTVFTDGTDTDTLALAIVNYDDLEMSITPTAGGSAAYDAVITGDFTGVVDAEITNDAVLATHSVNGGADFIQVDIDATSTPTTDGTADTITWTFDHNGTAIPTTGDVTVSFTVNSVDFGAAALNKKVIETSLDAGEWELDATIINVPYLPVGKEGTSSSVHLSNETTKDVDVIVSAIDQNGNVYAAVDLGLDLPKQTVTKVSQTMLMDLFSIEGGDVTKLSVTFNIDADKGDVNGYAFTTDDTGRTEISTSQQRGN